MAKDGCVDGLQVGTAGELDLKGIKEGHKAGVQHVPGTPRWTHGPNELDVLHVLPVELLATVIEALQSTNLPYPTTCQQRKCWVTKAKLQPHRPWQGQALLCMTRLKLAVKGHLTIWLFCLTSCSGEADCLRAQQCTFTSMEQAPPCGQ